MASHFSTIGLPIGSEEEMISLAEKAADQAVEIKCTEGRYLKWSSPEGAELWMQIDRSNDFVGLTPSFSGKSRFLVGITSEVSREGDTAFEGAAHGWANPLNGDPEDGEYPFVFELVDKAVYGDLDFPFTSEVELCAFAHEIKAYDSEKEYDASQTEEPHFAAESFVPSGLFGEEGSTPEPYGVFTGRVLEEQVLLNPLTDESYCWALVKTLGGTIDVLIDPELLEKPIRKDGIVSGSFWLNGKIKDPKTKRQKGVL